MKKIKQLTCILTSLSLCFCLFGCNSDDKESSKEETITVAEKVSAANDMATKIAEQSAIIAVELEMEDKFLSGTYTVYYADKLEGGEYADEFSEKLYESITFPDNFKMEISFNSIGSVSYVIYAEGDDRFCIGAYPDIVTVDEINNGSTYDSITRERADKSKE